MTPRTGSNSHGRPRLKLSSSGQYYDTREIRRHLETKQELSAIKLKIATGGLRERSTPDQRCRRDASVRTSQRELRAQSRGPLQSNASRILVTAYIVNFKFEKLAQPQLTRVLVQFVGNSYQSRGIPTLYATLGHIVAELQGERYLKLGVSYPFILSLCILSAF